MGTYSKNYCVCVGGTYDKWVGILNFSPTTLGDETRYESRCDLLTFDAATGASVSSIACDGDWTKLGK